MYKTFIAAFTIFTLITTSAVGQAPTVDGQQNALIFEHESDITIIEDQVNVNMATIEALQAVPFRTVDILTETSSAATEDLSVGDLVFTPNCTFYEVTRDFCLAVMTSATDVTVIVVQTIGGTTTVGAFNSTIQP